MPVRKKWIDHDSSSVKGQGAGAAVSVESPAAGRGGQRELAAGMFEDSGSRTDSAGICHKK